jgi:hypothetical protein
VDEIELRPDLGKASDVTTTANDTRSSSLGRNKEVGTNSSGSESERALKEEDKWGANVDTHAIEDLPYRITIKEGVAVKSP